MAPCSPTTIAGSGRPESVRGADRAARSAIAVVGRFGNDRSTSDAARTIAASRLTVRMGASGAIAIGTCSYGSAPAASFSSTTTNASLTSTTSALLHAR